MTNRIEANFMKSDNNELTIPCDHRFTSTGGFENHIVTICNDCDAILGRFRPSHGMFEVPPFCYSCNSNKQVWRDKDVYVCHRAGCGKPVRVKLKEAK